MKGIEQHLTDIQSTINDWTGAESKKLALEYHQNTLSHITDFKQLELHLEQLITILNDAHIARNTITFPVIGYKTFTGKTPKSGLATEIETQLLPILKKQIESMESTESSHSNNLKENDGADDASHEPLDIFEFERLVKPSTKAPEEEILILDDEGKPENDKSDGNKSECGSSAISLSTLTDINLETLSVESIVLRLQNQQAEFYGTHKKLINEIEAHQFSNETVTERISQLLKNTDQNAEKANRLSTDNKIQPSDNDKRDAIKCLIEQMHINIDISQILNNFNKYQGLPKSALVAKIFDLERQFKEQQSKLDELTETNRRLSINTFIKPGLGILHHWMNSSLIIPAPKQEKRMDALTSTLNNQLRPSHN